MSVLHLRTKSRSFEIVSTLLPDMDSYIAVTNFLSSQLASLTFAEKVKLLEQLRDRALLVSTSPLKQRSRRG